MINRYRNRYSRWDGTQQINAISADDVMKAISDELMRDGDLLRALRQLFREGFERPDGERMPGWWEMMNRVRQQRQEQLNRYDLGSIIEDIKEQLRDVIQTERDGIDRRIADGRERTEQQKQQSQGQQQSGQQQQGQQQSGQQQGGQQGADSTQSSVPGPQSSPSSDAPASDDSSAPDPDALQRMLEQIANRKRDQLDALPGDPAGAIKGLQDYDFMDPAARQKFQDLLAMLQQQVLQQTFQGMQQALGQMTPEDIAEMRRMMSELNDMLEARARGEDPNFEQFMHKWGHFFGPDVKSLDDLMEHMNRQMQAMNQLMESMSPEQRGQLESMMQAIMQDEGMQQQMARLSQNLAQMMPPDDRRSYNFGGDQPISLAEAMRLMDRLNDYDELEQQLKDVRDWSDFANLDGEKIRDLLGEETQEQMNQLSQIAKMLEDAGFIRQTRRGYELTPQGVRKIGEKALTDIFQELKKDKIGQHEIDRSGGAGERIDVTKPYEFGDPFLLDLPQTVMNAVQRNGAGAPVRLRPTDFEVYRTEHVSRSSTVLMIDMSRSMFYNQYFPAAKRIALALDSLIRSKYPRDTLRIIGFSAIAHELKPTDLPGLSTNQYQVGTNMQHGFQLARELLGREKGSNRQIIIITDGEPTAHIENGEPFFSWPPTPETWNATLREVVRCTRDGITINTFMLERSAYLMKFVNDLSKINGGRVFYASPDHLGEYILVDYVANKTKHVN